MALTEQASGTKTATGGEDTLATRTDGKTYCLALDLNNMVAGDVLVVRLKTKVLTGSTSRLAYRADYGPIPPNAKNVYSIPVPAVWELVATIQQVAGTNRNYDWSLISLD